MPPQQLRSAASTSNCCAAREPSRLIPESSHPARILWSTPVRLLRRLHLSRHRFPASIFAQVLFRFNLDLILLKPQRNKDRLPYSHWGGSDHGELKGPARDGVRALRFSGHSHRRPLATPLLPLPAHFFLPSCPSRKSASHQPREAVCARSRLLKSKGETGRRKP